MLESQEQSSVPTGEDSLLVPPPVLERGLSPASHEQRGALAPMPPGAAHREFHPGGLVADAQRAFHPGGDVTDQQTRPPAPPPPRQHAAPPEGAPRSGAAATQQPAKARGKGRRPRGTGHNPPPGSFPAPPRASSAPLRILELMESTGVERRWPDHSANSALPTPRQRFGAVLNQLGAWSVSSASYGFRAPTVAGGIRGGAQPPPPSPHFRAAPRQRN